MSAITFQQNGKSSEISTNNTDMDDYDTENKSCQLLEDDSQCGYIFFSESMRVLKFFCTFCRETYDDIYFFCEHLSVHINDNSENDKIEQSSNSANNDYNDYIYEQNEMSQVDQVDVQDLVKYDYQEVTRFNEDLDEAEEIAAEVEQEMQQINKIQSIESDNSNSGDFLGYDEDNMTTDNSNMEIKQNNNASDVFSHKNVTDFENLIDSAKKDRPTDHAIKKKNVKTVKIIAVKNKISELYERIKAEEAYRSRTTTDSVKKLAESIIVDSTDASDIEQITDGGNAEKPETIEKPISEFKRTIIGETIITLIPDTCIIPTSEADESDVNNVEEKAKLTTPNEDLRDRTCPACNKVFRNASSLTIHKRTHYLESDSDIKLAHKCSDCDKLFNRISDMKEHIEKEHYPDGYICKICDRKLSSILLLESHMKKVHLARPFTCEICKKNFSSRAIFEEHVQTHVDVPSFRCNICGRKYNTEIGLQDHISRHQQRVPQTCVVCGKKTLRITQHMKTHEPRPKRILSCSYCGKVFNFSSGLSHHIRVVHKNFHLETKQKQNLNVIKRKRNDDSNDVEEVTKKEEEAKKVIVELIHNATYKSFLPDNFSFDFVKTPPIAREETISAVNSISNIVKI